MSHYFIFMSARHIFIYLLFNFSLPLFGMLSSERQKYYQQETEASSNHLATMKKTEDSFKHLFRVIESDESVIDVDATLHNIKSSIKAATAIAQTTHKMASDTTPKFNAVWQRKKERRKKVSARWVPTNLPQETDKQAWWNPSGCITDNIDLIRSQHQKGMKKELTQEEATVIKTAKQHCSRLKNADLVWQREDGLKKGDPTIAYLADSFSYAQQHYCHALKNAAFNLKRWQETKKQNPIFLTEAIRYLYKAQGIKNGIFATATHEKPLLPENFSDFNPSSYPYVVSKMHVIDWHAKFPTYSLRKHIKGINAALTEVNLQKLQKKEEKKILTTSDKAALAQTAIQSFGVVEDLLKTDILGQSAVQKCLPENVQPTIKKINKFNKAANGYPTLKTAAMFGVKFLAECAALVTRLFVPKKPSTQVPLASPEQSLSLQQNLGAFLLHVRNHYQETKQQPEDKQDAYLNFLLKNIHGDKPLLPHSLQDNEQERAEKLTFYKESILTIEEELLPKYNPQNAEHNALKELVLKVKKDKRLVEEYKKYALLQCGLEDYDHWLKRTKSEIISFEDAQRQYEKALSEFAINQSETALKKVAQARKAFNTSQAYLAPEDLLLDNHPVTRSYVSEHADEFRKIVDEHGAYFSSLEFAVPQVASLWLKALLNKEYKLVEEGLKKYEQDRDAAEEEHKILKREQESYKSKSEENIRGFFPKSVHSAFSLLWHFYSSVKNMYLNWRMAKNDQKLKEIGKIQSITNDHIEELTARSIFQAYQHLEKTEHQQYVQEGSLEEKVKLLATRVDPLFWFALPPEKRQGIHSESNGRSHSSTVAIPRLTQPLGLPEKLNKLSVPQQTDGFSCGVYSCVFAERLSRGSPIENDDDFKQRLQHYRGVIREKRTQEDSIRQEGLKRIERSPMLDTAEVHYLLENEGLGRDILFIPDIYKIKAADKAVDVPILERLDHIQKKHGSHIILVSDMGKDRTDGHYITLQVDNDNGNLKCSVANSLKDYNCDMVIKDLMMLLSSYDFQNRLDENKAIQVTTFLERLNFCKVFSDKKYYCTGEEINNDRRGSRFAAVMESKRSIDSLISWLLKGVKGLLVLTEGKEQWTPSGFKDFRAIMMETLHTIENANGQSILLYPSERYHHIVLTEKQRKDLKELQHSLKDLKQ